MCQDVTSSSADKLSVRPQGTYFIEISFEYVKFSSTKINLEIASAKWEPFCLGLTVLMPQIPWKWDDSNPTNYHSSSGGRLNKKDGLTRYGDSHVKDKTS